MEKAESSVGYSPLLEDDYSDRDSMTEVSLGRSSALRSRCQTDRLTLLNLCLFILSSSFLTISILWNTARSQNWVLQQSSYYSPLFNRYKVNFVEKVVAGTLFNEESLSPSDLVLRSYPSPKVDAAWEVLTNVGVITITGDEVKRLGKDPDRTVKAPREWGFGSDAHLAQIDGQHALHCLNAVRRYAYRDYYYPHLNASLGRHVSPLPPFDQAHLSHCLHILLQTLSCQPSMDVITHTWVDTQLYPFPDFALHKKCMDHRQLLDWQSRHRLTEEQWMEMAVRGPGPEEPVGPMSKEFQKWAAAEDARAAKNEP